MVYLARHLNGDGYRRPDAQTNHRWLTGQPAATFYDDADPRTAPDERSTPA
ncbi:MAG: hypothetical protein LC799_29535 [Actinobacteria bacterium]|nr:hypothetical protein [Actinomycetota bacterium]